MITASDFTARPAVRLSDNATQATLAWAGDRYLAVWIEPAPAAPKIKLLELGGDGQPRAAAIMLAETENDALVGYPNVAANAHGALLFYQQKSGPMFARLWDAANGLHAKVLSLGRHAGRFVERPALFARDDRYFVCWAEDGKTPTVRWLSVGLQGEVAKAQTLLSLSQPITSLDCALNEDYLTLLWTAGERSFAQRFRLTGQPLDTASRELPAAGHFADAAGEWLVRRTAASSVPIIEPLRWK